MRQPSLNISLKQQLSHCILLWQQWLIEARWFSVEMKREREWDANARVSAFTVVSNLIAALAGASGKNEERWWWW